LAGLVVPAASSAFASAGSADGASSSAAAAVSAASSSGSWPKVSGPKAIPSSEKDSPWRLPPVRTAARRETFLRRHRGETGGRETVAFGEAPRLVERLARHHREFHAVGLEGAPVVDELGDCVGRHAFEAFLDTVDGHLRIVGRRRQRGIEDLVVGQDQQAGELAAGPRLGLLAEPFHRPVEFRGREGHVLQDRPMARGLAMGQRNAVG
jgi:hypothetical protein